MRYVKVPEPLPQSNGSMYGLDGLLQEFVLTDSRWRKEWALEFVSISKSVLGKKAGDVVALQDSEQEKLSSVLQAANIPPAAIVMLMPLIHAVTMASSEEPASA